MDNSELYKIVHEYDEREALFIGVFVDEYLISKYQIVHVHSKVFRFLFGLKQVKCLL